MQLGREFPFVTFYKQLQKLTRNQSSIILQIQCNHFPLNVYLHRIGKDNSDKCQECSQNQVTPPRETTNHFIFECPAHKEAINAFITKIKRTNFHLPKIVANAKYYESTSNLHQQNQKIKKTELEQETTQNQLPKLTPDTQSNTKTFNNTTDIHATPKTSIITDLC